MQGSNGPTSVCIRFLYTYFSPFSYDYSDMGWISYNSMLNPDLMFDSSLIRVFIIINFEKWFLFRILGKFLKIDIDVFV